MMTLQSQPHLQHSLPEISSGKIFSITTDASSPHRRPSKLLQAESVRRDGAQQGDCQTPDNCSQEPWRRHEREILGKEDPGSSSFQFHTATHTNVNSEENCGLSWEQDKHRAHRWSLSHPPSKVFHLVNVSVVCSLTVHCIFPLWCSGAGRAACSPQSVRVASPYRCTCSNGGRGKKKIFPRYLSKNSRISINSTRTLYCFDCPNTCRLPGHLCSTIFVSCNT